MNQFIKIAQAGVITDAPKLSGVGLKIFSFLLSVFGIIAIIGLAVSGVLYLTASGNENQIEKAKRAALYSVLGIIVALAAMVIVKTISSFL